MSNEVVPFLRANGLYPEQFDPPMINKLVLSDVAGKSASIWLDMGGFGISRYTLDYFLYQIALSEGVRVLENTSVESVEFQNGEFQIAYGNGDVETCPLVIGCFGKRSRLDKSLDRDFVKKRSPFVGVKYHMRLDFPADTIALYNFPQGYCGLSKIENDRYNLCYLVHRDGLRQSGSVERMEQELLFKNPLLKAVLSNGEMLFDKPEVINEISFERKALVENHVLMAGDAAGLITPLCGNGMAMAIHSAKLLSDLIEIHWSREQFDRFALEYAYSEAWEKHFAMRLWVGRQSQHLFGSYAMSRMAVGIVKYLPKLAGSIIRRTHGEVF